MGHNATTLVLSDGATDKTGLSFEGRTGGELAAELVVETCLQSEACGHELVSEVTDALRRLYERINPLALNDSAYRFGATMVAAKIVGEHLVITQVGDTSFRINGADVYTNNKEVDAINAQIRKTYIETTGDIAGSRNVILPRLREQHKLQNNPDDQLGYGVIDGTDVPEKFVKVFTFPRGTVHTLEIASDGYYGAFPEEPSIESYEQLHQKIEETDPYKCGEYASTKTSDDRAVAIAQLTE
jgi:hypothetical protein